MLEYYGKLSTLWEELQVYRSVHVCSCGAATEIAKEIEDENIHQFVMGLDDVKFGGLCTTITGMDPLPGLGEIICEEQRIAAARKREQQQQEVIGFVSRRDSHGQIGYVQRRDHQTDFSSQSSKYDIQGRPENSIIHPHNILCSHCGRSGHEKHDCWQIVGFPDWWNERNGG